MSLVRGGADAFILPGGASCDTAQEAIKWHRGLVHTAENVYREMMLQVLSEYSCLPDAMNMPLSDIVYFYEGRRPALRQSTKPQK